MLFNLELQRHRNLRQQDFRMYSHLAWNDSFIHSFDASTQLNSTMIHQPEVLEVFEVFHGHDRRRGRGVLGAVGSTTTSNP